MINLAVFYVSRRGRALLMETSFDLRLSFPCSPLQSFPSFSPDSTLCQDSSPSSSGVFFDKHAACNA